MALTVSIYCYTKFMLNFLQICTFWSGLLGVASLLLHLIDLLVLWFFNFPIQRKLRLFFFR